MMWGVFTHPSLRRRGLSRAVVETTLHHAFAAGVRRVNLLVYVPNEPALALYRSLGFVECGTEPEAIRLRETYFDGVHMTLGNERHNKSVNADAQGRPLPSVALSLGAGCVRR
jgi:ribosomal protein S18 acetylase RimI-like enzyme